MEDQTVIQYTENMLMRQGFVRSEDGQIKKEKQSKIEVSADKEDDILFLVLFICSERVGGLFVGSKRGADNAIASFDQIINEYHSSVGCL